MLRSNWKRKKNNPKSFIAAAVKWFDSRILTALFPKMYSIHSHFVQKGVQPVEGITSRNLTHLLENMKQFKYLSNAHVLSVGEMERLKDLNARDTKSPAQASLAQVCHYISVLSVSAKNLDVLPFFPGSIILPAFLTTTRREKKSTKKKLLLFGEFCEGENAHTTVGFTFSVRFFSDTSRTVSSMS